LMTLGHLSEGILNQRELAPHLVVRVEPRNWFSQRANYLAVRDMSGDPLTSSGGGKIGWRKLTSWDAWPQVLEMRLIPREPTLIAQVKKQCLFVRSRQIDVSAKN
jgi:hypothetical protein